MAGHMTCLYSAAKMFERTHLVVAHYYSAVSFVVS